MYKIVAGKAILWHGNLRTHRIERRYRWLKKLFSVIIEIPAHKNKNYSYEKDDRYRFRSSFVCSL